MGYVRVIYRDHRRVIIDDVDSGQYTDEVIEVEDGKHIIKLAGELDYKPPSHIVKVEDTSELAPLEVEFKKQEV